MPKLIHRLTRGVIASYLLAAPLSAQEPVFVTGQNGGPDTYIPLSNNASTLDASAINDAGNPVSVEQVILTHSAAIHGETVQNGTSQASNVITLPTTNIQGAAVQKGITRASGSPMSSAVSYTPAPFSSLANSVAFIEQQMSGTAGLPDTYYVPPGQATGNQVIDDGVGTYDTSLALMALIANGNLTQAKQILDIYNSGMYGNSVLSAYPTSDNGNAFSPFNSSAYYYFDTANASAKYDPNWQQYDAHTGPNAWLALAVCQYVQAREKAGISAAALAPYVAMATRIGDAMLLLQDSQTQGGIRYGPNQSDTSYSQINTENDLSAYSALNKIAGVTGQSKYQTAAANVLGWLQNATVYNPLTGQTQKGMMNASTGMLYVGAAFQNGKWVIQNQTAEDSGGSWAISALGPQTIDSIWGRGAALRMWTSMRAAFGRTEGAGGSSSITNSGAFGSLTGVDFSNAYASNQALISPEWTGGAVNALKQLIPYYQANPPPIVFSPSPRLPHGIGIPPRPRAKFLLPLSGAGSLSDDLMTMQNFLSQGVTSYAIGPGLTGPRQGSTGFGWQSAPASVAAMASIYGTLPNDPLAE